MGRDYSKLLDDLNHNNVEVRLESLSRLMNMVHAGEIEKTMAGRDVNNHIHTFYSFSPYSPSKAIWMAYTSGLETAGIMDHDSVSGAEEFIRAGNIAGIATTTGVECRAHFKNTPLALKRINNPDQVSIAYVAIHGIPHSQIGRVKSFFKPYVEARNIRNLKMLDRINNEILKPFDLYIDFKSDVAYISKTEEGGSITERHILMALSLKLIAVYGKGPALVDFLMNGLKLYLPEKARELLSDPFNNYYEYDLLGLLKGELVSRFYIEADEECPDVREVIDLSKAIGAICAYPYLGDVVNSTTGDKKNQNFEDDYLDLLFDTIKKLGFNAVTYMPSRNTPDQLARVRAMCDLLGLFQISGEDINSPRQSFICQAMRNPEYANLYDSTWALIGHEATANLNLNFGMFSDYAIMQLPDLKERIQHYKKIGLAIRSQGKI